MAEGIREAGLSWLANHGRYITGSAIRMRNPDRIYWERHPNGRYITGSGLIMVGKVWTMLNQTPDHPNEKS